MIESRAYRIHRSPIWPLPLPTDQQDGRDAAGFLAHGKALRDAGRAEDARLEFRSAIESNPTFTEAWVELARLLQAHGHSQESEDCLRLALSHIPDSFEIQNELGLTLLIMGKLEDAGK